MMIWEAFMTLGALMLPLLILICNFLIRKWSSNSSSNASQQSESTGIVDSSASVISQPDSTLPSASDASLALPTGEYEVFLSFRGQDTGREIAVVLYRFLVRSKIRTFKYDDDLRAGEGIWPSLVEAMRESKIYVPIFSQTYAHSKWCLKELAEMIECHKQDKRHIILPIFYKVDPGDVRKQSGPYEEAFKHHQKTSDDKTIKKWKEALKEVGELKGWHVTNKDGQGSIADGVFEIIWSHLSKNYQLMTDDLVGIDEHLRVVVERLDLNSKGVIMAGIHGIGGIGKTTIATVVYNKICARFDRYCFVENIRETLQQRDGIISLQNKIISTIARKESSVSNVSEGIHMIRDRVSHYKVLIVLDDVDGNFNFDGILGKSENFVSGSRFIITSRDIKVLTLLEGCQLYEVGEMAYEHSLQLFCKHAFRKDSPPNDYATLSKDIVSITGGLPLTIKVVGSLLFKEDKEAWEEKMLQLQETPETEVLERLKISYDGLSYEAKQIFLDIACFYIGEDKELVSYMWNDCKFYPISSINVLIQRSLIKIKDDNKFKMHDQLRDMGRAIIREEDTEHPWRRSRIWLKEDAFELLLKKKGSDKVKGLQAVSDFHNQLTNEHFMSLSDLKYLSGSLMTINGDFSDLENLRWLRLENCRGSGDGRTIFQMNKLVILDLRRSDITDDWGGWNNFKMAKKLKVLDLSHCSNITKLPDLSTYGNLEHLNLCGLGRSSTAQDLNISKLRNMKVLNLEKCRLRRIVGGSIGMLQGLQELYVNSCICDNLGQFLADIVTLPFLRILKATGVELKGVVLELPKSLKELHMSYSSFANLADLVNLEVLWVQSFADVSLDWMKLSKLKDLQLYKASITTMGPHLLPQSLTEFRVSSCPMLERLPNLENLENLTLLYIFQCRELRSIQGFGEGMKSLQSLKISSAGSLIHLDGLENLPSLIDVELESCNAMKRLLPFTNNLVALNRLSKVKILFCPRLSEFFRGPNDKDNSQAVLLESLRELEVGECESLQVEGLPDLSKFPGLTKLRLWSLKEIRKLEGLESLEQLRALHLRGLPSVERLPCLSKLGKLEFLELRKMPHLLELEGLEDLRALLRLELCECMSLERLIPALTDFKSLPADHDMPAFKELKELIIVRCTSLENLSIAGSLKLANLYISGCPMLHEIHGLGELKSLRYLWCESLVNLNGLENLPSLTDLQVRSCNAMERLLPIINPAALTHLCKVEIVRCPRLTEVFGGLDSDYGRVLDSLEQLEIDGCTSLESLPHLSKFPSLRKLKLMDTKGILKLDGLECLQQLQVLVCSSLLLLHEIDGLKDLQALERVALAGCSSLERLPDLSGLKKLNWVIITKCTSLERLPDVSCLKNLGKLDIRGCSKLTDLSDLHKLEGVEINWPDDPLPDWSSNVVPQTQSYPSMY
ncbi:Disease resistance protein L6 [Linum perenne]